LSPADFNIFSTPIKRKYRMARRTPEDIKSVKPDEAPLRKRLVESRIGESREIWRCALLLVDNVDNPNGSDEAFSKDLEASLEISLARDGFAREWIEGAFNFCRVVCIEGRKHVVKDIWRVIRRRRKEEVNELFMLW
jgi:hypothetical protein